MLLLPIPILAGQTDKDIVKLSCIHTYRETDTQTDTQMQTDKDKYTFNLETFKSTSDAKNRESEAVTKHNGDSPSERVDWIDTDPKTGEMRNLERESPAHRT